MKVTYHDPCELGRYCQVYDSPRNVLKLIPGLELVETERSRENCSCCGAGGGVFGVFTRMSLGIAYRKFLNEIVPLKVEALITACPTCYMNFSYVIKRKKLPIKLYDLTEIVNIALL